MQFATVGTVIAPFAKPTCWSSFCKANLCRVGVVVALPLICSSPMMCCLPLIPSLHWLIVVCPSGINILGQSTCGGSIDIAPFHISCHQKAVFKNKLRSGSRLSSSAMWRKNNQPGSCWHCCPIASGHQKLCLATSWLLHCRIAINKTIINLWQWQYHKIEIIIANKTIYLPELK